MTRNVGSLSDEDWARLQGMAARALDQPYYSCPFGIDRADLRKAWYDGYRSLQPQLPLALLLRRENVSRETRRWTHGQIDAIRFLRPRGATWGHIAKLVSELGPPRTATACRKKYFE